MKCLVYGCGIQSKSKLRKYSIKKDKMSCHNGDLSTKNDIMNSLRFNGTEIVLVIFEIVIFIEYFRKNVVIINLM